GCGDQLRPSPPREPGSADEDGSESERRLLGQQGEEEERRAASEPFPGHATPRRGRFNALPEGPAVRRWRTGATGARSAMPIGAVHDRGGRLSRPLLLRE